MKKSPPHRPTGKSAKQKKKPVLISELRSHKPAHAQPNQTSSEPKSGSSAPEAADAYAFVSQSQGAAARTLRSFRSVRERLKKHPVRTLQDWQFRALALLSQTVTGGKKKPDGKPDYGKLRQEWIIRRVLQLKPVQILLRKRGPKK